MENAAVIAGGIAGDFFTVKRGGMGRTYSFLVLGRNTKVSRSKFIF